MQQTKITKNILYIAILTTVVVITWVFTEVWHSFTQATTPPETSKYAEPIDPEFDIETLDLLNQRLSVPVNLSEQGDYISDPQEITEATDSSSLDDVETDVPDITIEPSPTDQIQPSGESL
jgi:hypothetical protein